MATMTGCDYTGLDYSALLSVIEFNFNKRSKRKKIFADVRRIESGALSELSKKKASDGKKS